ncbi:hypothetical protein KFK09_009428 [Dendrobium nobile]|uniref:DUF4283 domain-containing protein n=1 Tax=Dendrobium nobile TaxID=94219 RepID=A0A8T3BJU6_DENNO|nr:hypothetical protein KFK09_009428 [Dendrobium nobile]
MTTPSSSNPVSSSFDGKSRSFRDVLAGSSSSNPKLPFVQSSFKGCPALLFEDSVVDLLAAPYALTLVGKFVLRRPNLDVIRKFFVSLKLSGSFHVGLLDQRHVAIQLANDLDYSRIFARRSYYIQACQMRLLKWTPDFDVREESPIAPVWISFPNLRLHFFNHQILFGLASIFGRPLQTDQATASVSHPSMAWVLIELDVSKKHPTEIWIGSEMKGYFQKVEFENLPIFCSFCKMHGHGVNQCFRKNPNLRAGKNILKNSNDSDPVGKTAPNIDVKIVDQPQNALNEDVMVVNPSSEEVFSTVLPPLNLNNFVSTNCDDNLAIVVHNVDPSNFDVLQLKLNTNCNIEQPND